MKISELLKEDDSQPVKSSLRKENPKVLDWIKQIYDEFPANPLNGRQRVMVWGEGDEQTFAMLELVPSTAKDAVEVKWIQAYPLRSGAGSKAMAELQKRAKEAGISLTLYPWDKGVVSQAKLIKFYKKMGFKPMYRAGKDMIWTPPTE